MSCCDPTPVRRRIVVTGVVQGVGFRPFVARRALVRDLTGFVRNDPAGVTIEAEGEEDAVDAFIRDLTELAPPLAHILSVTATPLNMLGTAGFAIRPSAHDGARTALIPPDADVCPDCLRELFDPADRRYRYPFITCVNCGPRYTLITALPYDRPNTTMRRFPLCERCLAEYTDPTNRRFHAEPVACAACGPTLTFRDAAFTPLAADPLAETVTRLKAGEIVAIKGIGGYHLACDPAAPGAVERLRQLKERGGKPFALMLRDQATLNRLVTTDQPSLALLGSVARPIVLLPKRDETLWPSVAPGNRLLGVMLPYTPLHHLLFADGGFDALVMTSGNRADEPIVYEEEDARESLRGIADAYLTHDRPIETRADDSIERIMAHGPVVLRRSRGYAPTPILLDRDYPTTLGVGGEMKNTFCLIKGRFAYLGPHGGDLKYAPVYDAYVAGIERLMRFLDIDRVDAVGCDLHPAYLSTRYADLWRQQGVSVYGVQHHAAHAFSLIAERGINGPLLAVAFDGTGYGDDGAVWGGEFLRIAGATWRRVGTTTSLPLPGGEAAIREPWRIALALLDELFGDALPPLPFLNGLDADRKRMVLQMSRARINTPRSSGAGRHFDAVAALTGLCPVAGYEGHAALTLEMACAEGDSPPYPVRIDDGAVATLSLDDAYRALVADLLDGASPATVAARFHATLIDGAARMVARLRVDEAVGLTGGVFQNRRLSDALASRLAADGIPSICRHSRVPPNDGGIALGQALVAARLHLSGVGA
ncbi:MAG: carbamoyltransferase HypF [Nitrospinae bacterium]|nr:carbamoyltransferase HypF [Nitrospinota bacterium]